MFKGSKSKKVQKDMLKEGLLTEGGGLDASMLRKLNERNSEKTPSKKSKTKASDETEIVGLGEFNKYGDLFKDLTTRTFIDTQYDVVQIVITYDSRYAVALVNNHDVHFEV
jgi:hypothetical protein